MTKKVIFAVLAILLITSSMIFAEDVKEVNINGLGTISIPSNIEVSQFTAQNGTVSTIFLVNDNNVWRTNMIIAIPAPNASFESMQNNNNAFKAGADSVLARGGRVLQADQSKVAMLGGKKVITGSATYLIANAASNTYYYAVPKGTGVLIVMCSSADSDALYWKSFNDRMVSNARE